MKLAVVLALATLPTVSLAQTGATYVPADALGEAPRFLSNKEFPAAVSGFAFGTTISAGVAKCKKAGRKVTPVKGETIDCSGAAGETIFDGSVMLIACGKAPGKICEQIVALDEKTIGSLKFARSALTGKYGLPHARFKTFAEVVTTCQSGAAGSKAYADEEWWFGAPGAREAMIRLEGHCDPLEDGSHLFTIFIRYQNLAGLVRRETQRKEARSNF